MAKNRYVICTMYIYKKTYNLLTASDQLMLLASELLSILLSTFSFSFFGIEEPAEWIQNLYEV